MCNFCKIQAKFRITLFGSKLHSKYSDLGTSEVKTPIQTTTFLIQISSFVIIMQHPNTCAKVSCCNKQNSSI